MVHWILMALCACLAQAQEGRAVIPLAGFEDGMGAWQHSHGKHAVDTAVAHSGKASLRISDSGGVITDFPEAPSAAGTTWLLMVQQAMKDKAMRDAFWGPDQALINRVVITGPTTGWVGTPYTFTATVDSLTATLPITSFWQASGQDSPTTHTSGLSDTVAWSWTMPGPQLVTVAAINARDMAIDTHPITIKCVYLPIVFKKHTA